MRTTIVTRYVGQSLLLMLVSAGVAFLDNEDDSMLPLLFSAILTGTCGSFPFIFVRSNGELSTIEGYYIVVFSWLTCCIFGMIPYICYGNEFSLTDALFESVSGFTTTGASIIRDIESLPKGLLCWRMCTCWIGGIGIVTLFSLIRDTLREAAFQFTSIITTTGFATADTSIWPDMSILILITGSVICGCSGSTSGGIKLDRAVIMAKASRNGIIRLKHTKPGRRFCGS